MSRFQFATTCRPRAPGGLLFTAESLDISQRSHVQTLRAELRLSATEHRICALLLDVAARLNTRRPETPLTLRIAGGWVRDKLLGLDSHDLDIALDSLMGFEFATEVNRFLQENYPETDQPGDAKNISSISKIDSNPDKSKHLETATARIFGQMIDFVNLRTETYNEDSRIPTMEFGTPTQDAKRRDITINALFYNLHTREVEDFTELGLKDLQNGHVRTPLDPLQTFIDDPLRILRVIRFASRFNFSIEPDILDACLNHPEIRTALGTKISKERIGVEVDKMLATENVENALRAVRLIHEFGIAQDILAEAPPNLRYLGPHPCGYVIPDPPAPPKSSATTPATSPSVTLPPPSSSLLDQAISQVPVDLVAGLRVSETLAGLLATLTPSELREFVPASTGLPTPFSKDEIRLLFLAAMVSPYIDRLWLEKNKKVLPACQFVIMQSLKLSGNDGDWISGIIVQIPNIQQTVSQIHAQYSTPPFSSSDMDTSSPTVPKMTRKQVGLFIRELGLRSVYKAATTLGAKYPLAVFMAMTTELTQTLQSAAASSSSLSSDDIVYTVLQKYRTFWNVVVNVYGVDGAWQMKHLVDGKEVLKALKIKGPDVGKVLAKQIEFQLEHPEIGKEGVAEWIKTVDVTRL
ncbi:hypothetical protein BCR33DRAFT_712335 [Rhizoclosmatium globosum]|uniref:Poly A polymerase head domain-containing protein n=1 Tax=Rhizoclosmatium globosum TaxID=329046 RepID=A0A1Y2CYK3_9FUNG|nr:hypothetical protein BCR33DRAFT_712335 [Rhizoclosmatium globosum]|eukprot:ORY52122.1 hypothetical protein BCR33DRAFT_712335 [Rhizoclosmatium globosum]